MNQTRHLTGTNVALVSVFAGFIAASTLWGGIPLGTGVPVTLQTLAVVLAGAVLGPWRGAAAVVIYLVLGTAGAPIFAGHVGGPVVWASPTAGFLAGFVACAFVTGWLVRAARRRGLSGAPFFWAILGACAVGSLVVLNVIGWGYVMWKLGLTLNATLVAAAPFLVGDIVKVVLASLVASAVHRSYPNVLGERTRGARVEAAEDEPEESDALASA